MKYLILSLLCIMFFSCKNNTSDDKNPTKAVTGYDISDTVFVDIKGNRYKHLAQIPDSLYTPDQEELVRKISTVMVKYVKVEHNHMVLELTKEDFLKMGIPVRFYKIFKQSIKDNNTFFDTSGITNVKEMINESKADYQQWLNEHKK